MVGGGALSDDVGNVLVQKPFFSPPKSHQMSSSSSSNGGGGGSSSSGGGGGDGGGGLFGDMSLDGLTEMYLPLPYNRIRDDLSS
jgi:hypothetical protein